MKTIFHSRYHRALTMTEVLIVLTILVLLALVLLPVMARGFANAPRLRCLSNLKQIGLAFRIWSNDNDYQFPWMTVTNGGTALFVGSPNVFLHFSAISNELTTPKVFACPKDPATVQATNFGKVSNQNLSYFIGLTANESDLRSILSGDRNLTSKRVELGSGVFRLSPNAIMGWTAAIHNYGSNGGGGNIVLADGSAQQTYKVDLQTLWQASTNPTRRLAIP